MNKNPRRAVTTTKISVCGSSIISMRTPAGSDHTTPLSPSDPGGVLLSCLESARDLLARRLVHEHHTVTDPDLNYCTVSAILQILFLKTGQQCGFVDAGTLHVLAACDGIAPRMARACSDAGLSPDLFFESGPAGARIVPRLPDEPLRGIIRTMDHPDIPVPIAGLPLEDLVVVLEHFLGTRVLLAEGCRVSRAGKSALLSTGSVHVPSGRVVEAMVREAVGRREGRCPAGGPPVCRILDPACGSGVFLLAAYRYLVHVHTRPPDRQEQVQDLPRDPAGTGIFGTDIDPESVSAARIVLLFAFLDELRRAGHSAGGAGAIERVCAGLTQNIRCGNTLIAPDYFRGKPVHPFNADERRHVNAFDWHAAFPRILEEGGFDAVIGAPPPYRPHRIPAREEYFQTHYETYAPSAGLYGYFIERGLSLLKPSGVITVLVPGTFLRSEPARPFRRMLLSRQILAITSTGSTRRLPGGETPLYAISLQNQPPDRPFVVSPGGNRAPSCGREVFGAHDFTLDQRSFDDGGWRLGDTRTADLLEKIRKAGTPLGQYVLGEIAAGNHRVRNNPLVVDPATKNQVTKNARGCRQVVVPLLCPEDIRRYVPRKPERFVQVIHDLRKCRALDAYGENAIWEQGTGAVADERTEHPALRSGDFAKIPASEKNTPNIVFSPWQAEPAFCYDPEGTYAIAHTLLVIPRNDPFLAGILNSSLGRFVLIHTCPLTERGYHISPASLEKFPVYVPDFDNLPDKTRHDRMVSLVRHMVGLNRYLPQAKTGQECRLVQQEIDATDVRIDALVYELYGLTAEEIVVIEESSR